jgi:molecular chaperone DnaK
LGKFELVGIPPAPRGTPQIEVTFEVDANGILNVSAADKSGGRKQQMKVTPTSGLSGDEIDRMIAEAQTSAEADKRARELVVQRSRLEGLLRNTQRTFTEFGGSLSSGERAVTQDAFAECEELLKSENVEAIQEATQRLERIASQLTLAMLNPVAEHNGR